MRSLCSGALATAAGVILLFAIATPALAAETSNSEFVIIPEDDVFPGDLYAGAVRVVVNGTLDGDLIAFAAEEVVINGTVTGSVTVVAPTVTVGGVVEESLRVSGNRLTVTGEVREDVVAPVVDATLSPSSVVGGDVILWSWNASALGTVGGDLSGSQRNLELAGQVEGDVDVSVSQLTIVDDLSVAGDLGYRSDLEADGLEQVTVGGAIVNQTPLPPNLRIRALGLLGRFLIVLVLSVTALSIAYGWPQRTTRAVTQVGNRPVRNWLSGALILLSPWIAAVITGVILGLAPPAAAFPLLLVLVPVILALSGVALALGLVAGGPTAAWLGGVLFKRLDLYGSILVGSLIAGAVWYLPWVGWLVPVVFLPLGLGAWLATWRGQSEEDERVPNERMASSTS